MAMRAAKGDLKGYYFILENATRGELERVLDEQRVIQINGILASGMVSEAEGKNLERERGWLTQPNYEPEPSNDNQIISSGIQTVDAPSGFGQKNKQPDDKKAGK